MKIYATVVGDEALLLRIKSYPAKFQARLAKKVERLAIRFQARVKSRKLSGQVLNNRTGTLRRSINYRIYSNSRQVLAVVGANTPYAAIHEYGFRGNQSVRAFLRTIKGKAQRVKAHTRKVNMPERSYLRSTLDEMRSEILTDLRSIGKELKNE